MKLVSRLQMAVARTPPHYRASPGRLNSVRSRRQLRSRLARCVHAEQRCFRQCLRRHDIVERRRQLVEDTTGRSAAQQRKALVLSIAAGLRRNAARVRDLIGTLRILKH